MNPIGPQEFNGLHVQALRRAQALRREAIDDFWRGAQRLICRLARHAQRRGAQAQAHDCQEG